ncbi:MAG: MBL fold metallo-hydrolase [Acidimicrobiales bacterium]
MTFDVKTFRTRELGNSAHLVIDRATSTALVIDPVRDTGDYVEFANAEGLTITWALETHVHNDFVSGARELVTARGARLGASNDASLRYPYDHLRDGDEISLGSSRIRVLATPGHTPEHLAYLLLDADGRARALFSGGALMVGTAARTDLFGPALSWRFAHDLQRSLKEKILTLPDDVLVYPTHGGGSFCAVGAGSEISTTIGTERATNPLVRAHSPREFVSRSLTAGAYPRYYSQMRSLNQRGAALIGPRASEPAALSLDEVDTWLAQGALLVDVRPAAAFRVGHVPASLAIGADGNVSGWLGWLEGPERALVLLGESGPLGSEQINNATAQLSRIGYDRVVGFLDGGLTTWTAAGREITTYHTITAGELALRLDDDELLNVVDVREASEWHDGHVPGSVNIPVHEIPATTVSLPRAMALVVHCGHDFRATLGASLFERAGYRNLTVVTDGWQGWQVVPAQVT